jgi:DNA-binding HxlR family transcriptional regulator
VKESIEVETVATGRALIEIMDPNCVGRALLEHVTSRWGVLVIVALSEGTMRWGEIRRLLTGVTEKMLSQTLRTLEADGLVAREAHPVVPPRVDYSLTDRGMEAAGLLRPLAEWAAAASLAGEGAS